MHAHYLPWNQHGTRKLKVGRCWRVLSFWEGLLFGAMLVLGSVDCKFEMFQRFFLSSLYIGHWTQCASPLFCWVICWRPIGEDLFAKTSLQPKWVNIRRWSNTSGKMRKSKLSFKIRDVQQFNMLGIVRRFFDCGPIVGNELISGPLDFGRQVGLMYPYCVWVVGSTSHDVPVFNGFPSRHFISHSAERGQWNQIDLLDQDVVAFGMMVGEEATRNFMVGFGKSMNEMEWQVVFLWLNFKSRINPCHLLTQRHLKFQGCALP